jgi:hypothetical protein
VVLREVLTAYGAREMRSKRTSPSRAQASSCSRMPASTRRVFARGTGVPVCRGTTLNGLAPRGGARPCPEPSLCARTEACAPNANFDGKNPFQPRSFPDELAAQTYFWQNETAMRGALTPNDENICDIRRLLGFPSPRRKLLILQDRLSISGTSQFRPGPSPAARRQQVFLAERNIYERRTAHPRG